MESLEEKFLRKLRAVGLTDEDLGHILNPKNEALVAAVVAAIKSAAPKFPTYRILVDYNLSVEDLIGMCNFEEVQEIISSKYFPSNESGVREIEVSIIHFENLPHEGIEDREVIVYMAQHNLRPATLKELLTLIREHPEINVSGLLAFGSVYKTRLSEYVPLQDRVGGRRRLAYAYFDGSKDSSWHYAAVRL